MKSLFYSTKDFEEKYLIKAAGNKAEIELFSEALNLETAGKANGFEAISIFTGDDASAPVLEKLQDNGVKFIATRAAGYDNIDLAKARELGIIVANVPEYSPYAIAEHAVAMVLTLNRKIITADQQVHQNDFTTGKLVGFDLHGKTVGIIGAGRIGRIFARIMHGFGCRLLAYDIHENAGLKEKYGLQYVDMPTLCRESNIISIHTGLTPQTKHLINKKLIDWMQKGVMVINTDRGACLNTADMIAALESGHIGYFGADVYEHEKGLFFYDHSGHELKDEMLKKLLGMSNVLITPHQAFATTEALTNIATTTFYNLACWEKEEKSDNELTV